MTKTWRWFGPGDKVTLDMMRQIGVEGGHVLDGDAARRGVEEVKRVNADPRNCAAVCGAVAKPFLADTPRVGFAG